MPGPLVVSAVAEELGELDGVALGVGVVVAAATCARVLAERRPSRVIFVGTAGTYPGGPAPGGVVCARRVLLASVGGVLGLGYVPRAPGPLDVEPVPGVQAVDVVTVQAITTAPALVERLAALGQVEHLEAYGVALAAAAAGVPCSIVLGLPNRVGPDAHAEWQAHRATTEAAARAAVAAALG